MIARVVIAGTQLGRRQDDRRHRADGRARARGRRVAPLQGRPRLHRPQLPRARERPPGPQPRRLPVRPGAHRAAVPPRRAGRRRRRRRGRHGPLRRRVGPRRAGLHRARRQAAARAGRPRRRRRVRWHARSPRSSTATRRSTRTSTSRGVILNRVGSEGHAELLREAIAPPGVPVLGALRRDAALAVPERHLGLVPVAEREPHARRDARRARRARRRRAVDLDAAARPGAQRAADRPAEPWSPEPEAERGRRRPDRGRRAVPRSPSTTRRTSSCCAAAGAELVAFDPLPTRSCPQRAARSCSPAASPRSSARARRRTGRCAPRSRRSPHAAGRSWPSAAGCCTSRDELDGRADVRRRCPSRRT